MSERVKLYTHCKPVLHVVLENWDHFVKYDHHETGLYVIAVEGIDSKNAV